MLDILIEIIQELTGAKKKPPPQPRRRVRPPVEEQRGTFAKDDAGGRAAQPQPAASPFEDMMKGLFGGAVAEEEEAPPPLSQRVRTPPRESRKAIHNEPAPASTRKQSAVDRAYQQAIATETAETASRAPQPSVDSATPRATVLPDYVARLRSNPNAAREAFVYSEIFGPPLADREGGAQ